MSVSTPATDRAAAPAEPQPLMSARGRRRLNRFLLGLAMTLVVVVMLIPFYWMLVTSVKTPEAILAPEPELFPHPITFEHFTRLFDQLAFFRVFLNSVVVTVSITAVSLFFNALGGYAFAKFEFPYRNVLFTALLLTMMVPLQVTMLPAFLILKSAGLLNSYLGLIIPAATSVFGIFLMRQFMFSIPNALIESARIDGCGEFRTFASIVLPQCKPVLAALGIFTFMGAWQDFLFPLIILHDERMYTLPVALATLNGQHATDWGLLMAASLVVILPIALVFAVMQRRFVEGVTLTGLK